MPVVQAERPNRPSTRRSTRSTRNTNRDITTETLGDKRNPRVRPSTRGTSEMSAHRVQKPRRTASTRGESAGKNTLTRASTRTGSATTELRTAKKNTQNRQSKRPSRAEVYGERRENKQIAVPLQFIAVMFLVVIVSVYAFGLLREDTTAQKPDRPDGPGVEVFYEEKGTTSTNTGILRGHE